MADAPCVRHFSLFFHAEGRLRLKPMETFELFQNNGEKINRITVEKPKYLRLTVNTSAKLRTSFKIAVSRERASR